MDARSPDCVTSARSADLLLGRDEWGGAWISHYRRQAQPAPA